jgi:hypothetical protein
MTSDDALFMIGEESGDPLCKTIQVIEAELASQGAFCAGRAEFPGGLPVHR